MHAGNILCAMIAYLSVKSKGGKFIIRIEDVDASRCPKSAAKDIIETLAALGMKSDEPIIYQSERTDAYAAAEQILKSRAHVYPCFCSRAALHADDIARLPDGGILYAGTCKTLSSEQAAKKAVNSPPSYRIEVDDEPIEFTDGVFGKQRQNLKEDCGDFIIRRRDGVYAYQLAVVTDDGYSGITEVVRGADLLYDTPRQIYLQRLLGLHTPEYYHIPLVLGHDGRKLSKSAGDSAARLLKTKSKDEIIGALAFAANIIGENRPIALRELIPLYSEKKLPRTDIILPDNLY